MSRSPLTRRRFLTITACAAAVPPAARARDLYQWHGIALGARATITLAHPEARRLTDRARSEIDRLENIFSLYRPDSALSRLNADGRLDDPPFELLECLSHCDTMHRVTGGAFDPTVQPLWALYAQKAQTGAMPSGAELRERLDLTGWHRVQTRSHEIAFAKPGMALTLNGIAQGYIADRVADMLKAAGLHNVLVDTGELVAIGGHPHGGAWTVTLADSRGRLPDPVALRNMALASSAPLGTRIGPDGAGHILDPRTGAPAAAPRTIVSVTAPSAAHADALSTAGCLMDRETLLATVSRVPGAAVARDA